jgi:2-phospho-L-lactate guanylyltransferase (CobY/MobA/RfbA family)
MVQITVDKNELYSFIKQAVRDALQEEAYRLWMENLPIVSKEEIDDIETAYGQPSSVKDIAYSETLEV